MSTIESSRRKVWAAVLLAALVDRSGRELPIKANVVGCTLELGPGEHVQLTGPEPLALEVQRAL